MSIQTNEEVTTTKKKQVIFPLNHIVPAVEKQHKFLSLLWKTFFFKARTLEKKEKLKEKIKKLLWNILCIFIILLQFFLCCSKLCSTVQGYTNPLFSSYLLYFCLERRIKWKLALFIHFCVGVGVTGNDWVQTQNIFRNHKNV